MMLCVHWLAQCRRLLEFADKIFHRPDKHPEPLARGEGDLHLLVRHPVASDVHGGLVVRKAATGSGMILEGDPAERLART